jgi:alpha-N-arabinofuranosidase
MNMKNTLALGLLMSLSIGPATRNAGAQSSAPAQLSIQLDKTLHPVSPMLYGLMTEEINYSYDGGLYAEMVRNRTPQEGRGGGTARWFVDNKGTARATLSFDNNQGPSTAVPVSLLFDIKSADAQNPAGFRNEGYWGMAVKPDTTYKGSLYAKADSDSFGPLTASLINDNTGETLATTTIGNASSTWKRYEFTMKTGKLTPSSTNHLLITAGHSGKLWVTLVSLFPPTYKNRENGNRSDIMELMAGMHPKFLRLPGGNYLEGDQIDERFDWKTTLGPLVDRPTHRSPWNYQSTDGMGLLEFLEWTEDLNIEPVLAVFAGYALKGDYIHPGPALTPYVDDALDEIEFVTGDTSTKWGAVRAKLGHPKPFPLRYVEIGNEDWFDKSGSYEGRFAQFNKAIKAKYPQLQTIATMPLKNMKPDVQDDHYYRRAEQFYDYVNHYDTVDRKGPKIFVGEWATREGMPTTNLGAALGDAAFMTSMERNSDLIVMSSYAPLFVNVNPGGMQWESDLIGYNAASSYGSPAYYAQCLFDEYLGTSVPTSSITGAGDRLFYSVTNDSAKGVTYLKLVNATSTPQPIEAAISGATPGSSATVYTLSGKTTAETNSIDDPKRIVPVKSTIKTAAKFSHTIPPYAIQVVVMETK